MVTIGITFEPDGKEYIFSSEKHPKEAKYAIVKSNNEDVIVLISSVGKKVDDINKLSQIVRIASDSDVSKMELNNSKLKNANKIFSEMTAKHNLKMTLINSESNLNFTRIQFTYLADGRVDFRELLKDLRLSLKSRIELKQVGARDKAKMVGGIGPCGQILCCSSHLSNFKNISIKMAKNQNISLNPSAITGSCGKLKCCLSYENDSYTEMKKDMPKVGSIIKISGKNAKILSVDPIGRKVKIKSDSGVKVLDESEIENEKSS